MYLTGQAFRRPGNSCIPGADYRGIRAANRFNFPLRLFNLTMRCAALRVAPRMSSTPWPLGRWQPADVIVGLIEVPPQSKDARFPLQPATAELMVCRLAAGASRIRTISTAQNPRRLRGVGSRSWCLSVAGVGSGTTRLPLETLIASRGTDGSNPLPSRGESLRTFRPGTAGDRRRVLGLRCLRVNTGHDSLSAALFSVMNIWTDVFGSPKALPRIQAGISGSRRILPSSRTQDSSRAQ